MFYNRNLLNFCEAQGKDIFGLGMHFKAFFGNFGVMIGYLGYFKVFSNIMGYFKVFLDNWDFLGYLDIFRGYYDY